MAERLPIAKTYKLFINGQFPRSESGRSLKVTSTDGDAVLAHLAHASRKDLRDAVVAARTAADGWARRSAYNRGQILYRMGEMLEGRREEFIALIKSTAPAVKAGGKKKTQSKSARGSAARAGAGPGALTAAQEVDLAVERLIAFAGWADKYAQVLGCNNPVAGPYYNFTVPEPSGVVAVVSPDEPALLGLISLVAPPLCAGNTIVAMGSEAHPLATAVFAEVVHTSDAPAGVINLLTGKRGELIDWIAEHREIDGVHAANLPAGEMARLRAGAAENVKRVTTRTVEGAAWGDAENCESPWWIEPFVEMKTIWHPAAT